MAKKERENRQEASLLKIPTINYGIAKKLIEKGFVTIRHLNDATDEELLAVPGINDIKLQAIRNHGAGI